MRKPLALGVFLLLVFLVAQLGWLFPPSEWYADLTRPPFAPPNWVFGPVWTVLYVMIAVAGWLVWQAAGMHSKAVAMWGAQLVLNALWTPLFFGLHALGLALIEMTLLWLVIAACIVVFRPVSKTAAWLFVPYLAWVSFAWALNAGFWLINRGQ